MKDAVSPSYEFGPFQLDSAQHVLFREGQPLALEPKVLDTLLALVESHGQLMEKDALIKTVWPETFVEEGNLTRNIHHLRKLLGKDPGGREYIETVPKRGYRFVAEVNVQNGDGAESTGTLLVHNGRPSLPEITPSQENETTGVPEEIAGRRDAVATPSPQRRTWLAVWAAVVLLVSATALLTWMWQHPVAPIRQNARRLTTFAPEAAVTAAAISPDGNFLAYSNPNGLYIQTIATGETSSLSTPDPHLAIGAITWFPDGSKVLLAGSTSRSSNRSLWMVPVFGVSRPVKLGDYPGGFVTAAGAAVSPDGTEIAFESLMEGVPGISLVSTQGGELSSRIVSFASTDALGSLSWKDERHRYFVRMHIATQGGAREMRSTDVRNGQTETVLANAKLSGEALALPDGRLMYGQLSDAGTPAYSSTDYWQIQTDPRTGKPIGQPVQITTWGDSLRGLSASKSGDRIILQRVTTQHNVYAGDLKPENDALVNLRSLTFGEARDDYPHAWTPDSAAVYLESSRTGHWAIFQHVMGQATDEPVMRASDDVYYPRVSPDGRWLLYIERQNNWQEPQPFSLMRVPISGGLPQLLLKVTGYAHWGFRFNCPKRQGMACVLAERQGNQIHFRTFDPVSGAGAHGKEIATIDFDPTAPAIDWDLAPDGSALAWISYDLQEARIHILYFAEPGSPVSRQTDLLLKGWSHIHILSWSSDGRGWFVTAQFPDTWTLLFAGLKGDIHVLQQGNNRYGPWVVPSPDGRHLALSQEGVISNVWMLDSR